MTRPPTTLEAMVSIRSPYRSKGRFELGDRARDCSFCVSIRSPYRSKGRSPNRRGSCRAVSVSIRSPYRSKGRFSASYGPFSSTKFQSAPLTEARGDPWPPWFSSRSPRFNPLPLPKQGEIPHISNILLAALCFNPLPLPKQGEIQPMLEIRPRWCSFNPLPLPKQGEMSGCHWRLSAPSLFQSAPLTEARGDLLTPSVITARASVSIRSPYRSKGRCDTSSHAAQVFEVSIRSPYRSKGRFN